MEEHPPVNPATSIKAGNISTSQRRRFKFIKVSPFHPSGDVCVIGPAPDA